MAHSASLSGTFTAHRARSTAAQATLPAGAYVSKVSGLAALARLEEDWTSLETHAAASVFQSYGWVAQWCASNITANSPNQILIITGYHRNKLVFVWPMMKNNQHGLRTAEWLTSPSGQYGDVLIAEDQDSEIWHKAAIDMLRKSGGVDILRMRHVRHGSNFHAHASKHMIGAQNPELAPFMDLTTFKSTDEYEARYTSTQRKRRKKIRKELEAMGQISFTRLPSGAETDRAIDMALDHKIAWLTERGRINRVLHCPSHRQFLKNLARSNETETVVTETTVGGKPVSWEIGFRFNNTHFAYITSHDNALTDLSPGRLHMHNSQIQCIADGMSRFDLMIPHDAHKESWATGMVATDDFFLPMTWRGKLQGYAYLKAIRPILRKIYYALPKTILSAIGPLTCKH